MAPPRLFPLTGSARELLLRLHRWCGLLAGLYFVVIGVTGAALVFRIELQRATFPDLFVASPGTSSADEITLLRSIQDAYPSYQLAGIDAPTTARRTVLAYLTRGRELLTLLVDPSSARPLGVLPEQTWIRTLQDLHFNLLAGRTGRTISGIGALALIAMCVTGILLWWPVASRWLRALPLDPRRGWRRLTWDVHAASGVCSAAALVMWSVTGLSFAFGPQFRAVVGSFSPLTVARSPASSDGPGTPMDAARLIAIARERMPRLHIARIVLPSGNRSAFLVQFADAAPTPVGADLQSVYLDQFSGRVLATDKGDTRTAGDVVMTWVSRLHFGNFAGRPVQIVWFVLGVAPAILFVTGALLWWQRPTRGRPRG